MAKAFLFLFHSGEEKGMKRKPGIDELRQPPRSGGVLAGGGQ
jgi:hypothetical protein